MSLSSTSVNCILSVCDFMAVSALSCAVVRPPADTLAFASTLYGSLSVPVPEKLILSVCDLMVAIDPSGSSSFVFMSAVVMLLGGVYPVAARRESIAALMLVFSSLPNELSVRVSVCNAAHTAVAIADSNAAFDCTLVPNMSCSDDSTCAPSNVSFCVLPRISFNTCFNVRLPVIIPANMSDTVGGSDRCVKSSAARRVATCSSISFSARRIAECRYSVLIISGLSSSKGCIYQCVESCLRIVHACACHHTTRHAVKSSVVCDMYA